MPDDKVRDQGDQGRNDSAEAKTLKSADAQAARNSGAAEISTVEKTRSNASDGSLRRFSGIDLDAQNESIEIDFGDRVVSRNKPGREQTAPAIETKPVLKPSLPEELTAVALPLDSVKLPEELTAVAQSINEPLKGSVRMDVHPTQPGHDLGMAHFDVAAKHKPTEHKPTEHKPTEHKPSEHSGAGHGSVVRSLEVHGRIVPSSEHQGTLLRGSVEENLDLQSQKPKLENNHQGWLQAIQDLAKLPLDKQLQIFTKASSEGWGAASQVIVDGTIGGIVGSLQTLGPRLERLADVTDFIAAVAVNDEAKAAGCAGKVADSFAKAVTSSSESYGRFSDYLGTIGAASYYGDNGKIFRDADRFVHRLDHEWAQLPVQERTRILTGIGTELLLDELMSNEEFESFKESLVPKAVKSLMPAEELEKLKGLNKKLEPLEKISDALKMVDSLAKETREANEHGKSRHSGNHGEHSAKPGEGRHLRTETAVRGVLVPLIRRIKTIED